MRRGFSYLFFIFFIIILFTVISGFSSLLQYHLRAKKADQNIIQAQLYAQSAVEFNKRSIALPLNNQTKINLLKLISLPGFIYQLNHGGFKIVKNKNDVYFIGFTGENLSTAKAINILIEKDGSIISWREE